jgi:hypothetical protein
MSSKQFDFIRSELSLDLLTKITANPPSDRMMDTALINLIKTRLTNVPITLREVFVWNLYKEILDNIVRYSSAAPAIQTLMDLESFNEPPDSPDAFSIKAGNMNQAPWRINC